MSLFCTHMKDDISVFEQMQTNHFNVFVLIQMKFQFQYFIKEILNSDHILSSSDKQRDARVGIKS